MPCQNGLFGHSPDTWRSVSCCKWVAKIIDSNLWHIIHLQTLHVFITSRLKPRTPRPFMLFVSVRDMWLVLCADPLHGDLFVTIPIICLIDRQIVSGRKHSFFVDGDNDQNGKCSHLAANVNQTLWRLPSKCWKVNVFSTFCPFLSLYFFLFF